MMHRLKTELLRAAVLTFEELGFMFPNEDLYDTQRRTRAADKAGVDFNGPFGGRLEMTLYGDILSQIAANMLGEEGVPTEFQQRDALGEIVNVICGNMLPRIAGPKEVFHVGIPQFVGVNNVAPSDRALSVAVEVGIDEGRAELCLFLDSNAILYFQEQDK